MVEKIVASVFEQVEHQFKAFCALVVGVGHIIVVRKTANVSPHHIDFCHLVGRGSHHAKVAHIASVHTHYQVEIIEIAVRHPACTVREAVATIVRRQARRRCQPSPPLSSGSAHAAQSGTPSHDVPTATGKCCPNTPSAP